MTTRGYRGILIQALPVILATRRERRTNQNSNSTGMKNVLVIAISMSIGIALQAQAQSTMLKGTVSYLSSQNVYVKFASTEDINIGDTLFIKEAGVLTPSLVVSNKSSISCVCTSIASQKVVVEQELFFKLHQAAADIPASDDDVENPEAGEETPAVSPVVPVAPELEEEEPMFKQKTKGRISASSYSSMSPQKTNHRMRYAFSFRGDHLNNSRFSTDAYITFRHTIDEWAEVQSNFSNALKVYSLHARYDLDQRTSVTFGRKINPKISSMGAIDGLQFEKGFGNFIVGALAGSRPDYSDYSFNFNLLQAGAYIGHVSGNAKNNSQSTFGVIEQRSHAKIDRRFVYFQHSHDLMKNLNFFGSAEMDLYESIHEVAKNTLKLTNLYLSLRYRYSKALRFSLSYDQRNSTIYYESFKNFIDRLIEDETRQGLRFSVNIRPLKYVTWGINTSWRFQKSDINVSKNLNSYLSISRVPGLNVRASITANFLQTNYINSKIYGVRVNKDIIKGKLSSEVYFRLVNYDYLGYENTVRQKIAGLNLSFRLMKKLSLYVYYEGTLTDKSELFSRFNTKIIQRF
jgi:hypothetical protein